VTEPSFISLRTRPRNRERAFIAAGVLIAVASAASVFGRQPEPAMPALLLLLTGFVIATGLLTA
jgi:hypothetical protein